MKADRNVSNVGAKIFSNVKFLYSKLRDQTFVFLIEDTSRMQLPMCRLKDGKNEDYNNDTGKIRLD